MAPQLEQCFTMRLYISKDNTINLHAIKNGPTRTIVPVTHGFIEGSGLKADILGGGDWILSDPATDIAHLDVRAQARTGGGQSLYVHYKGVLKLDEKAKKVLSGAPDPPTTNYGDHVWFNGPIFETSDPAFKWVEGTLFIGQGRFVVEEQQSAVEYQIYKVVN